MYSLTTVLLLLQPFVHRTSAQCSPCELTPNGFAVVPGTGCSKYVNCLNGAEVMSQSCNSGLIFDVAIVGCNWENMVTCSPDPDCLNNSSVTTPSTVSSVAATQGADVQGSEGKQSGGNNTSSSSNCEISLCDINESGRVVVPFSSCSQYVQCTMGVPGMIEFCPDGQMYSLQTQSCNIISQVTCPPDPSCPPIVSPTKAPSVSSSPTFSLTTMPTQTPSESTESMSEGENATTSSLLTTPDVLEGIYVIDAHLDANKIAISRELLTPREGGEQSLSTYNPAFTYYNFKSSLHKMIITPINGQSFYIGQKPTNVPNGRVYGLVNIAAFLSQSFVDSIKYGSCDEVNSDIVQGVLPISNACGQNGMDYQNKTICSEGEEKYACEVDDSMRFQQGGDASVGAKGGGPDALYCGPTGDYDGFTGFWDYVSNTENRDGPVQNALGRTDVEGCCWWGRGVLQTRGVCQYGKLNYFLGKKAADQGRPSMFPDIDFCKDPSAVCTNEKYPDINWIAGLFRWVMDIQTYDAGEFNYMQELIKFVDGGFKDWSFIHQVSGVVTQGCHNPPCFEGADFNGVERKDVFVKTLKLLGFNVNDAVASS